MFTFSTSITITTNNIGYIKLGANNIFTKSLIEIRRYKWKIRITLIKITLTYSEKWTNICRFEYWPFSKILA